MKNLFAFLLFCFSALASATSYTNYFVGSAANTSSSPAGACSKAAAGSTFVPGPSTGAVSGTNCVISDASGKVRANVPINTVSVTCTDPQTPNVDGVCTAPPAPSCTAGDRASWTFSDGTGPIGSTQPTQGGTVVFPTSDGTCDITNLELVRCFSEANDDGKTKNFYCDATGIKTGQSTPPGTAPSPATPSPSKPDQPASTSPKDAGNGTSCPKGTVSLGIDSAGGMICGGSGTSSTTPTQTEVKQPTATVTNSDGSTTKTDSTTRTNTDGSTTTTTTTTTTGTDGKSTTTVTQSTSNKPASSGGGAGTNDSSDQKKNDFCTLHPELNACNNSTVSGGCSGPADTTACTGDAITCAMLKQQRLEYCQNTAVNPQQTLAQQVLAGNDPQKSTLPSKDNATPIAMQSLDQSGFLGAGTSCVSDKSITVQGYAINLPFSKACPYLIPLRFVMMTIAALISYRIISKPVLGG